MPDYGLDPSTLGPPSFRARSFINAERFREIDRWQQYYDCTQHDFKRFDFDGRLIPTGPGANYQPLLSAEPPGFYVPLKMRRPSSPYRLARIIVNAFTNLLFGEARWPEIMVDGDEETQDFCSALVDESGLDAKFIQARNLGGSTGTVGVSWRFAVGKPRVEVHNAKHLYVHEWADRDELIPAHVMELYRYPKDEWDGSRNAFVRNWYWFRRDWTPVADVQFRPVLYKEGVDPVWEVDEEMTGEPHTDGECHFVWIQNMPSMTGSPDGISDCHGLWDQFDTLDTLNSVLARGTTLNLDPTLVLRMDPTMVNRVGLKKGSDHALVVGEGGDASYLEMSGSAVEAGIKLFEMKRRAALEAAECVVPDPNEIVAQGMSGLAMRAVYMPMLSKGQVQRKQYGRAIVRLLQQMLRSARKRMGQVNIELDAEGNETQVEQVLDLPPRQVEAQQPVVDELGNPATDEFGMPTGEMQAVMQSVPRTPGMGEHPDLKWPEYFPLTPDDQTKIVTTLSLASGGIALLSQDTSIELAAAAFGKNPTEELRKVREGAQQAQAQQAQMFADQTGFVGGQVQDVNQLPEGAEPIPGGTA